MSRQRIIGIYKIQSKCKPDRFYIGSSVHIYNRWRQHRSSLRKNKHHSVFLQRHIKQYGICDLEFSILEICEEYNLLEREQYYVNTFTPPFNTAKDTTRGFGGWNKGIPVPKEQRDKQSGALIGRTWEDIYGIENATQRRESCKKTRGIPGRKHTESELSFLSQFLKKIGELRKTPILQYDLNMNFIAQWDSIKSASESLNISKGNICMCLKGKRPTASGFIWVYDIIRQTA